MKTKNLISLVFTASLISQGAQVVEPNDTTTQATVVYSGNHYWNTFGVNNNNNYIDWYKLVLSTTQDVVIWTGPGPNQSINSLISLQLRNSVGTTLVQSGHLDSSSGGIYPSIKVEQLPPDTYYIIAAQATDNGTYTIDFVTGNPNFYIPSHSNLVIGTSAPEPDDPRFGGLVKTIHTGNAYEGILSVGGSLGAINNPTIDYDVSRFQINSSSEFGYYTFDIQDSVIIPPTSGLDTELWITDSSFNILFYNNDKSSTDSKSRINCYLDTIGTYYVVVSEFLPTNSMHYQLGVWDKMSDPTPQSSLTYTPAVVGPQCLGNNVVLLDSMHSSTSPVINTEKPIAGSVFCVEVTNTGPGITAGMVCYGTGSLIPLWDMASLGFPDCFTELDYNNVVASVIVSSPQFGSTYYWDIPLPAYLAGLTFYMQALSTDSTSPNGNTLSNRLNVFVGLY